MRVRLAGGLAAVAAATIAIIVLLVRGDEPAPANDTGDPLVEEFRSVERRCIAAFNDALRRQRANEIDELALAAIVESDVLGPWRTMRARVAGAPVPAASREVYAVLRRYLENRQVAWEAYAAALRADSDAAARPHYDVYHQRNADAHEDVRSLGRLFRGMMGR